jgi:hypothetical protein
MFVANVSRLCAEAELKTTAVYLALKVVKKKKVASCTEAAFAPMLAAVFLSSQVSWCIAKVLFESV